MSFEEMFKFKEIDGGYELARYYEKGRTYRVEIPGQYMGKPVLRIGEKAFAHSRFFEVVSIPPEVTEIGEYAFNNCPGLSAVEFSEGLKRIAPRAFAYCNNDLISLKFSRLYDSLLDAFAEMGDVELTAWLLEYKKRNCGFDTEDNYEL